MSEAQEITTVLKSAGLNRDQRAFCKLPSARNIRLLAPAGSGKTFSLLWRCKTLAEMYRQNQETASSRKQPAPHFLIVAFTRAARFELENRIKDNEAFQDLNATVRTLNAWGWEQNHTAGKKLAVAASDRQDIILHDLRPVYSKYPTIKSIVESSKARLRNAAALMDMMDLYKSLAFTHRMTIAEYKDHVRDLKALGLMPVLKSAQQSFLEMIPEPDPDTKPEKYLQEFFRFWKDATVQLKEHNRYTLEDQKYWAWIQLEEQIAAGKHPTGAARYTHVFVDEFQDVNPLDMALISAICRYHGTEKKPAPPTIIGDDDQAIFGWRGTTPRYILDPETYFDVPFTTCVLETNYRSPKDIVVLSNRLLSHNRQREPKQIRSVAKGRAYIKVVNTKASYTTIATTMKLVHQLIEKKGCREVALIGRRQVALFPYQVLLSAEGTPYHVADDMDIFDGKATQTFKDVLRTTYRAKDDDVDDPLDAVFQYLDLFGKFGIAKAERTEIISHLQRNGADSFSEALRSLSTYEGPIKGMTAAEAAEKIADIVASKTVAEFIDHAVNDLRGLSKNYEKAEDDSHYKEPQFFRLADIAEAYGSDFRRFYADLEKARKAGERSRTWNRDETGKGYNESMAVQIFLMTATRSKGREFDAVIILDADDEEWPNQLTDDIEEERRLFHVAMSRAKRYLYFVRDGRKTESPFLREAGVRM